MIKKLPRAVCQLRKRVEWAYAANTKCRSYLPFLCKTPETPLRLPQDRPRASQGDATRQACIS